MSHRVLHRNCLHRRTRDNPETGTRRVNHATHSSGVSMSLNKGHSSSGSSLVVVHMFIVSLFTRPKMLPSSASGSSSVAPPPRYASNSSSVLSSSLAPLMIVCRRAFFPVGAGRYSVVAATATADLSVAKLRFKRAYERMRSLSCNDGLGSHDAASRSTRSLRRVKSLR